jgi:hypothetical protein
MDGVHMKCLKVFRNSPPCLPSDIVLPTVGFGLCGGDITSLTGSRSNNLSEVEGLAGILDRIIH